MAVVATGFFDGVHLGHRLVVDALVQAALERGEASTVLTFWPHPRMVLQKDARSLRLLSTLDEKRSILHSMGVDRVEVIRFTKAFSTLSAEEYLREVVIGDFRASAVVIGYDNRMGHDGKTPSDMVRIANGLGLDVIRPESLSMDGIVVSSTKIREALSAGDVRGAASMMGRRYTLHGVVVAGNRMGRTIGFPTANMKLYEPLKMVPGVGVYLVDVETLGKHFHGMCNIGYRPTVSSEGAMTIETNIFDFDEDIYGLDLTLSFVERIRPERKFSSLSALGEQLSRDRDACLGILSSAQVAKERKNS